jgi:midasin
LLVSCFDVGVIFDLSFPCSVLESSKTITLAEKCGAAVEVITGHPNFQIIATMNPGGDFGKKELSPALMNRFTSIWVPQLRDSSELSSILENRLSPSLRSMSSMMIEFWRYFEDYVALPSRQNLTIREMLCWVEFVNCTSQNNEDLFACFWHGCEMVVIDGLGLGSGVDEEVRLTCLEPLIVRNLTVTFFLQLIINLQNDLRITMRDICKKRGCEEVPLSKVPIERREDRWGIPPFFIWCNSPLARRSAYNFDTETTYGNLLRLLRAMQLHRPILLEGSPGVGKTTLVEAMSNAVGTQLIRVNLSDQTDMMDLLGANLPSAEGGPGDFVW